eukprot:GDKJ01015809.1.p1 GENE.GDKJ01015809.1~~GDKJ01015809.1.p1  ORF type:complete len:368 (-),score=73.38 GDKJ01015809.1:250-1353(-)
MGIVEFMFSFQARQILKFILPTCSVFFGLSVSNKTFCNPNLEKHPIMCESRTMSRADMFDKVRPAVLRVYSFNGNSLTTANYIGSAFIVEPNGLAVTAAHLFENERANSPIVAELADGSWMRFEIVAQSTVEDIAVIRPVVDVGRVLPHIPLPPSKECPPTSRQGEEIMTYGCVQYCDEPVTVSGTVSQPKQTFSEIDTQPRVLGFVQMAMVTSHGMSGAPFFSCPDGTLSGMIVKKYEEFGLGLPLWHVSSVVETLKKGESWNPPKLGLRLAHVMPPPEKWGGKFGREVMTWKAIKGVEISEIVPNGAAARAGLERGDIVTRVNDFKIECPSDFMEAVARNNYKDVKIVFLRKEEVKVAVLTPIKT